MWPPALTPLGPLSSWAPILTPHKTNNVEHFTEILKNKLPYFLMSLKYDNSNNDENNTSFN